MTQKQYTHYPLQLIEKKEEAPDTWTLRLKPLEKLTWNAGDHTHLVLGTEDPGPLNTRHFSFVTLPDEGVVSFTTRVPLFPSPFKTLLQALKQGDIARVYKINGYFGLRREDRPIVLISAGVGIATMRPLIREFLHDTSGIPEMRHINIDSSSHFIYKREMDSWAASKEQLENCYVSNRTDFYERLEAWAMDLSNQAYYYVVGSGPFRDAVQAYLREKGVVIENILFDKKPE